MSRVGDTAQRTALALAVIMLLGSLFVTDAHVSLKFPAPASPVGEFRAQCYNPMPPAGVKILFLLGWMDVVVARSRQVVVLAM